MPGTLEAELGMGNSQMVCGNTGLVESSYQVKGQEGSMGAAGMERHSYFMSEAKFQVKLACIK